MELPIYAEYPWTLAWEEQGPDGVELHIEYHRTKDSAEEGCAWIHFTQNPRVYPTKAPAFH